jgi:RHS repeat-associated protein
VTCSTAAGAFTTYTTYNAFGDVKTVTDPLGHQSVKTYDADRNLKTAKDPDNNLTTYTYDSAGELTDVARADGTHLRYDYWPDGSLNHSYDAANQATTYAYDPLGRLQTETDPNGRATTYGYDPAGNRTTMQQPGGTCGVSPKTGCVTYVYDAADQLTSVTYSDTPAANVSSIGYDADGQRTSMTDGSGTSSWMWDSLHRMTQSSVGGQVTGYAYKLGGELTQIVYPGQTGAVNRTYDEAGHLLTVTDWAGRQTQFTYDADGFTTSEADPSANGVTTTFTPDGADRLMGITHAKGGATVASFSYGRDNADQVNSVTSTGVPADNHSYSYTQLNQLKNVDASAYGYSNADNLTTLTSGATMGYDSANQATSLVSGAGTVTIGYDNRGDRKSATTRSGGTTYAYDQANRLTSADPTDVSTSLAAGWYHSLVAKADGTVWAFGYNAYGQLGNNSTTDSSTPAQVPGLTGVVAVAAGAYHSVALRADGTVWTWGANGSGQLGNNSTVDSHVPVQVQGLTDVVAIAAGTLHTLALRADGTVWAWGHDANGQLGNNSTTNSPVPVLVQGLTNVVAVAGGYAHSVALRADGTVWGWGYNGYGQLGNNTTTDSLVAVQVPGLAGVAGIASGFFHTMALKAADGSVWGWGYNGHGQLGNNSTVDSHVPVAASGLTNVAGVRAGEYSSAAVKPDATTAAWGYNAYGQLGTGTTTDVSVPTAVGGLSTVRGLSPGAVTTLAAKTDGTVWAWGYNGFGEVGDGTTTTPRPSPQAVPNLSRGSATLAAYAYRGDGLRASKTVAGQTRAMAWDESASVPTLLSDGDRTYVYGPGGRPIEQVDAAGAVTYLHQDQDGSTRLLTNASGAVVATYTYDPYGRLAASTGSVSTPLRYAGEYTDAETGFVYLRARYYDPATGQFISRDPLTAMTGTPYSYVDNNPLNDTDPNGLLGWSDLRRLARGALHNSLVRYAIEAGGAAAFCAGTGGLGCTIIAGALIGAGLRVADRAINGCPTDGWGLVKAGFRGGIEGGVAGLLEGSAEGRELKISDDLRIAPGGNRGGEELPHYHRRVIDPLTGETEPGQGIGRHRPWQTKSPDTSFWDRF